MIRIKLAAFVTATAALFAIVCGAVSEPLKKVNTDEMLIALTFDDGPHPVYTPQILDILKEYNIRATFFVVGENVDENPEIIRREIEEGHEVGTHTYTHPLDCESLGPEKLSEELKKTETALFNAAQIKPALFRPPCGNCGDVVASVSGKFGYKIVLWSVDTRDWTHPASGKIVQSVLKSVSPGAVILCHDYVTPKSNTPQALRTIIPELISKGYKFVTVSELANAEK